MWGCGGTRMRTKALIGVALLVGCLTSIAHGQCINTTSSCGSSVTAYLSMCRLPVGCKNPDYASNLENALIDIDTKFAPTAVLQGHAHRGTDGDGPKLDISGALDCTNSPSNGQVPSWNSGSGKCTWVSAGAGSGDVTGPGSSTNNGIVIWDGTNGDMIKDSAFWTIDPSTGDMVTPGGNIGIGSTPLARFTIDQGTAGGGAAYVNCSGTVSGTVTCSQMVQSSTSSDAGVSKIAQAVSVNGTWNGGGSHAIAYYADVTGGSSNDAFYSNSGNIILTANGGNNRIGIGDTTPDALIDLVQADDREAILIDTTGARLGGYEALTINNSTTGGASGQFNTGGQITVNGATNGINAGLLINVSNGAEANAALIAQTGDIYVFDGKISASNQTANARAGDFDCSSTPGDPAGCLRVTADINAPNGEVLVITGTGTEPEGIHLTVSGDGSGGVLGMNLDATNANGSASAILATIAAESGTVMNINAAGEADTTSLVGMDFDIDGNGGSGIRGLSIQVHDSTDPQAIGADCTQTTGGAACAQFVTNGDGSGDFQGFDITVAGGGGTANTIGLVISASGGGGTNTGLAVTGGDVWFGPLGAALLYSEGAGAAQTTFQLNGNQSSTAFDINGSGTGNDVGLAFRADHVGTVTAASVGSIITNTQSSSTNSINKVGLQVNSTGSWTGTGAINAAIQASATDGTINYGVDALQGGMRTDDVHFKAQGSAPRTCDADAAGDVAYAATSKLLCICSDSDGSNFEYEAIEDRTVTCSF